MELGIPRGTKIVPGGRGVLNLYLILLLPWLGYHGLWLRFLIGLPSIHHLAGRTIL